MAGTLTINRVARPYIEDTRVNGEAAGFVLAAYLSVTIDEFSNGLSVGEVRLLFADYAGLEAEWNAGAATTVLVAALTTAMASSPLPAVPLTSAQKALAGTQVTIA